MVHLASLSGNFRPLLEVMVSTIVGVLGFRVPLKSAALQSWLLDENAPFDSTLMVHQRQESYRFECVDFAVKGWPSGPRPAPCVCTKPEHAEKRWRLVSVRPTNDPQPVLLRCSCCSADLKLYKPKNHPEVKYDSGRHYLEVKA